MPTVEQLKARFPRASESFIRANADGIPLDGSSVALRRTDERLGAQPAVTLDGGRKISTTDEDRLNKTERRWLAELRSRPFYIFVGIQPITLKLAWVTRYTPDFVTVTDKGLITCWEVKGSFVFEKAMYKPRACAGKFPFFQFCLAQWKGGKWTEKVIMP